MMATNKKARRARSDAPQNPHKPGTAAAIAWDRYQQDEDYQAEAARRADVPAPDGSEQVDQPWNAHLADPSLGTVGDDGTSTE